MDKKKKPTQQGKLTKQMETFVQELIKDKSQRQAYKIAYPKSKKWTDKTIDERASRLFNTNKVFARYNEINDRLIKESEDECIVDAKEILREYKKIAFSDIKDYLSYKTVKTIEGHDEEADEPIINYSNVIDLKDSDEVDGRPIQEVSISAKGTFTFKLHNKLKALEKLGEHVNLFEGKKDEAGKGRSVNLNLSGLPVKKFVEEGESDE